MLVWILTFFVFSTTADGRQQTMIVSGVYKTQEACLIGATAESTRRQAEMPTASVQLGSSPCNQRQVEG